MHQRRVVITGMGAVTPLGHSVAKLYQALIGRAAKVVTVCRPDGQVRVAGELWQARSALGADPGDEVVIRGVEGLTLLVD